MILLGKLLKIVLTIYAIVILLESIKADQIELIKLTDQQIDAFRQAEISRHNELRKLHHAPPLQLNDTLNVYAQQYAEKLAKTKTFQHSHGDYGQNLYYEYYYPARDYIGGTATQAWYDQVSDYDYNHPGFSQKTGHFTQVVWLESELVGFGIAFSKDGQHYVVAEYDPPGNVIGFFAQNVLPI